MGNRLCKNKRLDTVDSGSCYKGSKNQSRFDKIFSRFQLKPTTWKSESHLSNQNKQISARNDGKSVDKTIKNQPISKSTDWTHATLEVPAHDDKNHLIKPSIFDNSEKSTPTPPPRKHHKKNLRERIESVTKSGLQALQIEKKKNSIEKIPVEVEEPICVAKKINYKCPVCDSDDANHNRDHHRNQIHKKNGKREANIDEISKLIISNNDPRLQDYTNIKKNKRNENKNGSVTSLPNYTELKLSVAKNENSDEKTSSKSGSRLSLESNQSKTSKLDSYLGRVRSFGSLIPQKFNKVKSQTPRPQQEEKTLDHNESDDSFGPLEDWDLGLIEHYNPKEASLPRPRKNPKKINKDVLSDIEGLVVVKEDASEPAQNSRNIAKKEVTVYKNLPQVTKLNPANYKNFPVPKAVPEDVCLTPPPSPKSASKEKHSKMVDVPLRRENVEHSNLLRILRELSPKPTDKEQTTVKNSGCSTVEQFINAEKLHTDRSVEISKLIISNNDPRLQDYTNIKKNKRNENKNGSVTSLPNYTELKLSVAKNDEKSSSKSGSRLSLESNQSKTSKLDSYLGRVRSFGSLIPQKFNKTKSQTPRPQQEEKTLDHNESGDSFGPLEDWDLGLIEHYNPKEASLPIPRKNPKKINKDVLSDIEGLVVMNEDASEPAQHSRNIAKKEVTVYKNLPQVTKLNSANYKNVPVPKAVPEDVCLASKEKHSGIIGVPLRREKVEHSNLLRILRELSPKPTDIEQTSVKNSGVSEVEQFINAEKVHTDRREGYNVV